MTSKLKILENMIRKEVRKQMNEETNLSQYGIKELRDGLTIEIIESKFPWVLKAKIKDAVLGQSQRKILWYSGTWLNGTRKNGTWLNGTWKNGTWNYGWWYKGTWENGTWKDGWWHNGTWLSGTWKDGVWLNGTWSSSELHPNER